MVERCARRGLDRTDGRPSVPPHTFSGETTPLIMLTTPGRMEGSLGTPRPTSSFSTYSDPPSLALPSFTKGVLTARSRHLQSTAFQIITGHTFEGNYSLHFRQRAGDNVPPLLRILLERSHPFQLQPFLGTPGSHLHQF
jgi:hypothetical protein